MRRITVRIDQIRQPGKYIKGHDIRNRSHDLSKTSARGSVRCLVCNKGFKIHESGGDCHGVFFPHQPADPLPVPEKVREFGTLASHIMVGDTQIISIFKNRILLLIYPLAANTGIFRNFRNWNSCSCLTADEKSVAVFQKFYCFIIYILSGNW